jgi:hypothetical protein
LQLAGNVLAKFGGITLLLEIETRLCAGISGTMLGGCFLKEEAAD